MGSTHTHSPLKLENLLVTYSHLYCADFFWTNWRLLCVSYLFKMEHFQKKSFEIFPGNLGLQPGKFEGWSWVNSPKPIFCIGSSLTCLVINTNSCLGSQIRMLIRSLVRAGYVGVWPRQLNKTPYSGGFLAWFNFLLLLPWNS